MKSTTLFIGLVVIAISALIVGIGIAASDGDPFGKRGVSDKQSETNRSVEIGETLREIYGDNATLVTPSKDELLGKYEKSDRLFKRIERHGRIIYRRQRTIDDAIVEKDRRVYIFDRSTKELIEKDIHWRDNLPEHLPQIITREEAEFMVEGKIMYTDLWFIDPDSWMFPIKPTPRNPCWAVRIADDKGYNIDVIVIDAVEGKILGHGVPWPSSGFSFSGPQDTTNCTGNWSAFSQNAASWFNAMGYPTEAMIYPNEEKVKSHIQSTETAVFYEVAHGNYDYFTNDCSGDPTTADDIHNWISGYTKMPFTFLHSCEGMCEVGPGTFSYEFRKGSVEDTVTVGICGIAEAPCNVTCGPCLLDWQDTLFSKLSQSWTVKDAFDWACDKYEECYNESAGIRCVRFAGDENFKVVPVVGRIPIGEAVDNTDLSWTTGGDSGWFGQASTYYYDGDAAQSGDISDNQNTWMKTTVSGPGDLSFYWKVSSEYYWDYLRFYVEGIEQDKISGSTSWIHKTYSIDSGTHTLTWKYTKDGSISTGEDCGWVDKVEFTEGSPCFAESAVHQAKVSKPDEVLNPLRKLRDEHLKNEYVACYYEYSPDLTKAMTKDPAMAYEAARLLAKHSPMVKHSVNGISEDKLITMRDIEQVISFTERLKRRILEDRKEIGVERSQEIVKLIDEFKEQVEASEGKTFSEALQGSIYYKGKQMPDIVKRT